MDQQQAAEVLRNLDLRTKHMEQILPDLPTRTEMHEAIQAAIAPLATKEELAQAIAPLATKQELREGLSDLRDELRRHMDVRFEQVEERVKLAFEASQIVDERHTRNLDELRQSLVEFRRTEGQHHAAMMRNFDELRGYFRDYVKMHAREHVKIAKSLDNLRGRVEKVEARQPRKRKVC